MNPGARCSLTRMRTLALVEFLTVDGVMQGLGSPDEDREGGFAHGGWAAPYASDDQQSDERQQHRPQRHAAHGQQPPHWARQRSSYLHRGLSMRRRLLIRKHLPVK